MRFHFACFVINRFPGLGFDPGSVRFREKYFVAGHVGTSEPRPVHQNMPQQDAADPVPGQHSAAPGTHKRSSLCAPSLWSRSRRKDWLAGAGLD